MAFDYFRGEQSEQYVFYRIPKVLYTEPVFRTLSPLSKQLYGILLDRVSLSAKHEWLDEEGRIYVYCTIRQIMEALDCSDKTATKLMTELERIGLIEKKRQGLGKPNRIYVKNFMTWAHSESKEVRFKNRKNYDSGVGNSTIPESENLRPSNTDKNKTESNKTDLILSADETGPDARDAYRSWFEEALAVDIMKERYPTDAEMIDEIFELILDTVCTSRKTIMIAGEERSAEVVRSRFMKLNSMHLEYVLDRMKNNTSDVRNIKQYLLATLYNAPLTISNYYTALVSHDMAEGKI